MKNLPKNRIKWVINTNYPDTKSDLFATFVIRCLELCSENGLTGNMTPFVWMFISSYEKLRKIIINKHLINNLIQLEYSGFDGATVPICTFTLRKKPIVEGKGNYIRLSDFRGSENQAPKTLEAIQNPNCGWFYTANQKDFKKIPKSSIAYWIKKNLRTILQVSKIVEEFAPVRQGFQTGNNERFIRLWHEVEINGCGFRIESTSSFHKQFFKYAPYNKGGEFRKWYGNNDFVVKFNKSNYELLKSLGNKLPSRDLYFQESITWTSLSSSNFGARKNGLGFTFSAKGACAFPKSVTIGNLVLSLLNSKISSKILEFFCPTLDFNVGDIRKIPFSENLLLQSELLSTLVEQNIDISRREWDDKEVSWDFQQNPLIKFIDYSIDLNEIMNYFKQYWVKRFIDLHYNEEQLNLKLIDLYSLSDEISPIVLFEDVTILQDEIDRKSLSKLNKKLKRDSETNLVTNYNEIELPFIASEIMAQFISYSVGCMFGRYSLDKEGLILANQGETLNDFEDKISEGRVYFEPTEGSNPVNVHFPLITYYPDEDNIIPILEDEWFEDDIVGKFYKFLKVTFGEENFNKNLAFIEEQIGKDIRKYFLRDFYADHIRRYKKRPIYWMFSSPKCSFNVLIYMHRYTPDTVSNILNKYLKAFIGKLNTRKEHLQHVQVTGSASDINKAIKEIDSIDKILIELQEYERDILYPLATERIAIDLDDGVLVNYNKFGKALREVDGLNDKKTKEKVKKFDWIDTSTIK